MAMVSSNPAGEGAGSDVVVWSCTRDNRTTPCGECDGCRWDQQQKAVR